MSEEHHLKCMGVQIVTGFLAIIDKEAAGDYLSNYIGEQFGGALSETVNSPLAAFAEMGKDFYSGQSEKQIDKRIMQKQAEGMNRQMQADIINKLHSEMGLTDAQRDEMIRRMEDGEYDMSVALAEMQEGVNGKFGEDGITINQKLAQQAANDPEMAAKLLGTYVEELTHAIAASIENGEDLPFDEGAIVASTIMKDLTSQEGAIQFAIDTGEGFEMFATDSASIGAVHESMYPVERLYADVTIAGTEYSMDFVGPEGGAVIDPTSLVAAFMGELNDRFNPNLYRDDGLPSVDSAFDTETPYEQLLPEDVAAIQETMIGLGMTDEQLRESMGMLLGNVTTGFLDNFDSAYGADSGLFSDSESWNPYERQDFFEGQMDMFAEHLAYSGLDASLIDWSGHQETLLDLAVPEAYRDLASQQREFGKEMDAYWARDDVSWLNKYSTTAQSSLHDTMYALTHEPGQVFAQAMGGLRAQTFNPIRSKVDAAKGLFDFAMSDDPNKFGKMFAQAHGAASASFAMGGAGLGAAGAVGGSARSYSMIGGMKPRDLVFQSSLNIGNGKLFRGPELFVSEGSPSVFPGVIFNPTKGLRQYGINPMSSRKLEATMNSSEIGAFVLQKASEGVIDLRLSLDHNISIGQDMGYSVGNQGTAFVRNTQTFGNESFGFNAGYQQTSSILVHEGVHALGVGGSRKAEALARIAELEHNGVEVNRSTMRQVLEDIGNAQVYDDMDWKIHETSPHFPNVEF